MAAFAVFASLGASAMLWSLRWPSDVSVQPLEPSALPATPAQPPSAQALRQVLGAGVAAGAGQPQPADASLVLSGVVAHAGGQGSALIAVAGAGQKNFRVGATVAPGLVLQAVRKRQALLGPELHGPTTRTLELPASPATLP